MKYRRTCFFTFLFLLSINSFSQNSLSGSIVDAETKEPLPGSTVFFPDLKTGTAAIENGNYQLEDLPAGRFLVEVKFLGYATISQTIEIKGETQQNFELKPSVTEIGTVVITGVSAATEARMSPVPHVILEEEDLNKNSSTNIVDAIAEIPGISQITTGPGISKPIIRGLGYNRIVTLNNGLKQEGQQWGDEHGIEIDQYAVQKVEIIKGPGSLMYGSDALAGVVNFLPPSPVSLGKIIGKVTSNFQTNNNLFAYSLMNAGNLNGLSWKVQASQKKASNFKNPVDGEVYNSGFDELNFSGYLGINKKWGYAHLDFSSFNQSLGLIEGERDSLGWFLKPAVINGTVTEVRITEDDLEGYGIDVPSQDVNHLMISSSNNFILDNSRLTLNLGYQQNKRKEFENPAEPDDPDLFFDLKTVNYDLKYFLPETQGWETTAGFNGMYQVSKNKGDEFLIPEYDLFDFGIFTVTEKSFNKLNFMGGIRLDVRTIKSDELLLDNNDMPTNDPSNAATVKFRSFDLAFSNVTGSLGATYIFSDEIFVKLNFSRGFRAPNIAELGSNGVHEGTIRYEIGNPGLDPEKSTQIDAGFNYNSEHISLELGLFNNDVEDYIFVRKLLSASGGDSIPVPGDSEAAFKYVQNDARLYGGEFRIDIHPHPLDWLHFENTFSVVRGIQKDQPDSLEHLPFIPAPKFQSLLRTTFEDFSIFSNAFFKIGVDHFFRQDRVFSAFDTETETPGYTLLNLGLGSDIIKDNRSLFSVYINVENLFDEDYQNHLSRLKRAGENPLTNRTGIFNMGRNISFKIVVPITFKE